MKAAVIKSPGRIAIEPVPDPVPGPGEVLLKVEACALCGTDQRVLAGEKHVDVSIVGHEIAGTAVRLGDGVSGIRAGKRYSVQTVIGCGRCPMCKQHRENLCERGFTGCRIEDSAKASFGVSEQQVTNLSFMLRDCVIDNRHSATEAFRISSGHGGDIAGLRIEGLTVIEDDTNRPPIKFIPRLSNGLLDPVVARVRVRNSAGEESAFDGEAFVRASAPLPPDRAFQTRPLDLGALKPLGAQGKRAGEGLRVRRQFEFLQWARAGQTLSIAFTNRPVHRYAGPRYSGPLKVAVWAPSRTVVAEFGIPFDGGTNFVLDARETGIYRFEIDARMQTAGVVSGAPGHGLAAAESLYLFGCSGRLYFYVPAGIRDIRIEAAGATFALLDPDGNPVDSVVNHEGSKILHAVRPDVSRGEVWSVRFTGTTYLRVGAPLAPVLSTDPANVLAWEPAEGAGPREAAGGNETD